LVDFGRTELQKIGRGSHAVGHVSTSEPRALANEKLNVGFSSGELIFVWVVGFAILTLFSTTKGVPNRTNFNEICLRTCFDGIQRITYIIRTSICEVLQDPTIRGKQLAYPGGAICYL